MTAVLEAELLGEAERTRAREVLARIDNLRAVRRACEQGVAQTRLAQLLHVTQPTVHNMLRRAAIEAPEPRSGTHGGTAYEIAVRCAAGEIDRGTMRRELTEWQYTAPSADSAYPQVDDVRVRRHGDFDDQVGRAYDDGFLTGEDYDAILHAVVCE